MYLVQVFYPAEFRFRAEARCEKAGEVMAMIATLKAQHEGCERIRVETEGRSLFVVACAD